jgi:hypothetical protein
LRSGNDHDEDSDKEPEPPTKVADKPLGRSSKRNAPDVAPGAARAAAPPAGADRGGRGGRRGNFTGNERGTSLEHKRNLSINFNSILTPSQPTVMEVLPTTVIDQLVTMPREVKHVVLEEAVVDEVVVELA